MPGERFDREVIDYLATGVKAGMVVPDAARTDLQPVRVVIED
ncbi:arginine 2-monooxygenase [Kitasatospora sp. MBT63]